MTMVRMAVSAGSLRLAGAACVLAAAGVVMGCAAGPRPEPAVPSASEPADDRAEAVPPRPRVPSGAFGAADVEIERLSAAARELEQRLGAVESELLAATARATASMTEAEATRASTELVALFERRIGLTLALRRITQAIERRMLVLRLESRPRSDGAAAAATSTATAPSAPRAPVADARARADVDELVAQVAQELAALRERGELSAELESGRFAATGKLNVPITQSTTTAFLPEQGAGDAGGKSGGILGLLGTGQGSLADELGGEAGVLVSRDGELAGVGLRGTDRGWGGVGLAKRKGAGSAGHGKRESKEGKADEAEGRGGQAAGPPKDAAKGVAAAVVQDSASPVDLSAVPRRHLDRMLGCLPANLRTGPGLRIDVKARLGADGGLYQPRVSFSVEVPVTVESCLVDVLARLRFPAPPDGASRVVSFPLWLGSGG
jgi:hypothetical protein